MRTGLPAAVFTAFAAAFAAAPLAGHAVQGGPLPGPLPLFSADNWWNADVSAAPVDSNRVVFIAWIGATKGMLMVDQDHRFLFETWNTRCLPAGSASCAWRAGSGAVFSLDSNARRPDGWTSADAAGLAILPGLVRYDEATGTGPVLHAFRVTLRDSNGYVYPASHVAGSNPNAPPLGTRLRLKASKDLSTFPAIARKVFQAMKTYGLIVADNGTDLYMQGTYDTRWDNGVLNPAFSGIHGTSRP
jgi:hypothetical protein